MAIYGDQLAYFPEQFRSFEYCSMNTQTVSGYDSRTSLGTVRGVLQYLKKGELTQENDALSDVSIPTFWTRKKLILNNFLIIEDEVYKITNDINWLFQGGFYCYILETVTSNTDVQEAFTDVDYGTYD